MKNFATGHQFKIRHHLTCASENAIYAIWFECEGRMIPYTGNSLTPKKRFSVHKSQTINHKEGEKFLCKLPEFLVSKSIGWPAVGNLFVKLIDQIAWSEIDSSITDPREREGLQ